MINEIMSSNTITIADYDGEASDWVEFYNAGTVPVNLQGHFLSDDADDLVKWAFPDIEIPANDYLFIWASGKNIVYPNGEIHTSFKIKSSGENIFLTNPDGTTIIDQCNAQELQTDISYGRNQLTKKDWLFFSEATPGQPNSATGFLGIEPEALFSHDHGFYSSPVSLVLSTGSNRNIIRYTLDGSVPTENSPAYSSPLVIDQTATVRAKVFCQGHIPSLVMTNTYIFETDINLDVVSLTTEHNNLWGNTGIYTNYESGEEKPIHIEYLKRDGTEGFHLDAGVKIHAPDSKPQKSFRLYAREGYGTKSIDYQVFEEKEITHFKRLVLRNGGNDGLKLKKTHIRDAFTHRIYQQLDPNNAVAAYIPVHVYINGDYFGIYNLRERQDEYYIKDNFGYNANEIDFLEYDWAEPGHKKTVVGDWVDFENLKSFVISNDISNEANFQTMENWMDMDNFIDYQIIEIFIGNQDWFNNNIKFWRPKADGGKWKWVLWDTEYGLGTYSDFAVGQPEYNFVHMAMTHGGWGNDDYTWLLRKLMENSGFRQKFIIRMLDLMNSIYLPAYTVEQFNILANDIAADVHKQFEKWGSNQNLWENDLQYARDFMAQRPGYFREHLSSELGFDGTLHEITVNISSLGTGMVKVNTILIDEGTPGISSLPYPWTGTYYKDMPIKLKAIAKPGYEFISWEGASNSTDSEITLSLSESKQVTAIFDLTNLIENKDLSSGQLRINLFPVPVSDKMTIEITNPGRQNLILQVYNVSGQCVFKKETMIYEQGEIELSTSRFKSGVHILKTITDNGNVDVKKFIVKH
jgi:hypothetical protein